MGVDVGEGVDVGVGVGIMGVGEGVTMGTRVAFTNTVRGVGVVGSSVAAVQVRVSAKVERVMRKKRAGRASR